MRRCGRLARSTVGEGLVGANAAGGVDTTGVRGLEADVGAGLRARDGTGRAGVDAGATDNSADVVADLDVALEGNGRGDHGEDGKGGCDSNHFATKLKG